MRMLKHALAGVLGEDELDLLCSAFDSIGDIVVIKIPPKLKSKEKLIGRAILHMMKNIRTVLKQESPVRGDFRIRDLSFVVGVDKFETIYVESGCRFKVDLRAAYFSPRLSTERERIRSLVRDGERILNMFAGVGTFSIIIAKNRNCVVDSLDMNPRAINLAIESIRLNRRLKGLVNPIVADAAEYARSHRGVYDRVLMPLPEKAISFLASAFECASERGCSIHYYLHVPEEDLYSSDWITDHLESLKLPRKFEVANWKKVREVGPGFVQAVADIYVLPSSASSFY